VQTGLHCAEVSLDLVRNIHREGGISLTAPVTRDVNA
jgi:hypothetical protein